MFDSLPDAADEAESQIDGQKSSWWIGRWAHVIAMLIFSVLYFPFANRTWSWQIAITIAERGRVTGASIQRCALGYAHSHAARTLPSRDRRLW